MAAAKKGGGRAVAVGRCDVEPHGTQLVLLSYVITTRRPISKDGNLAYSILRR